MKLDKHVIENNEMKSENHALLPITLSNTQIIQKTNSLKYGSEVLYILKLQ